MPDHTTQRQHPAAEPPSRRSPETEAKYFERYRVLERQALVRLKFYGHVEEFPGEIRANARDVVDQLKIYSENHSVDSFRLYKSAVLFRFNEGLKKVRPSEIPIVMAEIKRATAIRPNPGARKASKAKKNSIPEEDFDLMVHALVNYKGRSLYGDSLSAWIKAGLATGLRPNEWEDAKIEFIDLPGCDALVPHLVCRNSKRKVAGPAFRDIESARQEYPELEIETVFDLDLNAIASTFYPREMTRRIPLNDDEVDIVQRHLDAIQLAQHSGSTFLQYYDSCRKLMARASRDLFDGKANYTLYTLRHQYAANGKKIFSRAELAERMGHDSIKTAENSYASNHRAHKGFKETAKERAKERAKEQANETETSQEEHGTSANNDLGWQRES